MAQKPPADKYFRDMDAVHKVFFLSAVAMLAVILWMSWDDYDRDWKGYQRQFEKEERKRARAELVAVQSTLDQDKINQLKQDLKTEEASLKQNRAEHEKILDERNRSQARIEKKKTTMAFAKSELDAGRFQYEEHIKHGPDPVAKQRFDLLEKTYLDAKQELMREEATIKDIETRANAFTERRDQLKKALDRALKDRNLLQAKIEKLSPSPLKFLLNAPILDFVAPTNKIQQVPLPDLHDDYNFLVVEKVDRCHTCHLGIEKESTRDGEGNIVKAGYDLDEVKQPFRAHPRLDLFVGSKSKHPLDRFGCSACHGGAGQALSFLDAGHTPKTEEDLKVWKKKYHWKPLDHEHLSDFLWDYLMLPGDQVEASCLKCHQGVVEIPEAPALNAGRRIFEDYGCYGCHKTVGFTELRKPGPPLTHLQEKVSPAWVKKWLKNPKAFRPTTRMPRFFDLSNTSAPEDVRRSDAEIEAITAYLYDQGKPHTRFDDAPGAGDSARGRELFESVGCRGCHTLTQNPGEPGLIADKDRFGPDLAGLGSKITSRNWLYTWLREPTRYFEHTKMPSLRLTETEAADVTAYLIGLKNREFDAAPAPQGESTEVDAILRDAWSAKMTSTAITDKLRDMQPREKWVAAGQKLIGHYGCFGCHDISGFEKTNPIGTELSEEGSKDLDKLDFGGVHDIEHTRTAWFGRKLADPRAFDHGKIKDRLDKLRMPQFDFTEDQIEKLVIHILSLTKDQVRPERRRHLSAREELVEKGRRMVRDRNCYGCHTMDGHDGVIRAYYTEDAGLAPPILWGEGKKVQGYWLYEFLKNPGTIRPWLNVRMPTFGFTDEEATAIITYFQAMDDVQTVYRPKDHHRPNAELAAAGGVMFDKLQCMKCHVVGGQKPEGRAAGDLAPDLAMAKSRLNPDWILDWLSDPNQLMPGTRMPTYFTEGQSPIPDMLDGSAPKQIRALRDHILTLK
ncbi:c-type cytochrome [bacterium]|nr:c-type cytochrome [bacterium]